MTIGERVRGLRKARGVSQEDLARSVGVVQSAISKIERDLVGDPGVLLLAGIAQALGVSLAELVGTARLAQRGSPTPLAAPDDRLRAIEERVDLVTTVLRKIAGAQLEAAIEERAVQARRARRTGT